MPLNSNENKAFVSKYYAFLFFWVFFHKRFISNFQVVNLKEMLTYFICSSDLEVQERSSSTLAIFECIYEHPEMVKELMRAYSGELNPVAPKAQKKVTWNLIFQKLYLSRFHVWWAGYQINGINLCPLLEFQAGAEKHYNFNFPPNLHSTKFLWPLTWQQTCHGLFFL